MSGLRELARRSTRSWDEADASFAAPRLDRYNIAADCLRADPACAALLIADGDGVASVARGELDAMTARLAAGLCTEGLERGDRVAVKLSQSLEMALAILATLRAGGVVVPVSNVLGADGVGHRLGDSGARFLVGGESDEEIARGADVRLVTTEALLELVDATSEQAPFADTAPDTPALLLYTSGTTGKPKGVLHGHRVVLGHHPIDFAFDHIRPDDVAYSPVDWAWAGGLFLGLLVPLAYGVPVIAYRERRFDAERTLRVLRECRATIGLFPPTVLRMLRHAGVGTGGDSMLRCFITGAEAVEPDLFSWAKDALGVTVNNAYGLTEANALVGHSSILGALDPACLGRPYPGRRVEIQDEAGRALPAGEIGEIAVDSTDAVCMLGYWNDPRATTARISGGWLHTGDTAHAEGRVFYFHGRSDDIIKSGAYRIGPAEVEAAMLRDPRVAACAVVGLPDPVRGQVVTAIVQLRAGGAGSDDVTDALKREVRDAVGAHAYPREIRYVDALPLTVTGKVDRATVRRNAETEVI